MSNFNINSPDIDLEQTVIGEMFINEDAAIWFFSNLKPDEFNEYGKCRAIYEKALVRFQFGMPYDAISIVEDMGMQKNEYRVLIYNICVSVQNAEHYKEHCRLLKNAAGRKKIAEISNEAMNLAVGNTTITEMQTFLADRLELFDCGDLRKSQSAFEGMSYMLDHADEKREYIETGLSPIDSILKISRGDYVIMGARPSVGKTAFALQVAFYMGFKYNVVFFSFETNSQKIYDRVVANQCSVPFPRIIKGNLSDFDKEMIRNSLPAAEKNHFTVVEASGMTVAEIQAEAVRRKAEIIFVDYIGLISSSDDVVTSEYEKVTKISKDLHNLAQKRGIAIFALSQLSREGKENPDMSNLRSSGQIEADADSVILMSRAKNRETQEWTGRCIQIAKNKVGELGYLYMHFDGEYQKFIKCDKEELYE